MRSRSKAVWLLPVMLLLLFVPLGSGQVKPDGTAKVRGRVMRKVNSKRYPAPYVRVSFAPKELQNRRRYVYTGADGMFYLTVSPGLYALEVWNSQNKSVAKYSITVDRAKVDVELELP